jgi:DnaJ-domain-containing protein 1
LAGLPGSKPSGWIDMKIGWTEVVIIVFLLLATSGIFRRFFRKTFRAILEAYEGQDHSSGNHGRSSTAGPRNYHQQRRTHDGAVHPSREQEKQDPYEILNIHSTATQAEITSAYRRLAQLYHPDKVAGLAPEFTEIAERKMKNINAAYHTLKRNSR